MTRMTLKLTLTVAIVLAVAATSVFAQDAGTLKTEKDKRSYALGMDLGNQLRKLSVDVDPAVFAKGLGDALTAGKTLMTEDDVKAAIARLQADLKARQMEAGMPGGRSRASRSEQEGRRRVPAGEREEDWRSDAAERPAVQGDHGRRRQEAGHWRHGGLPVPGHAHRRHGVRQLVRAQPAGDVQGDRRHPGLDRGLAAHARRVEVARSSSPRRSPTARAARATRSDRTRRWSSRSSCSPSSNRLAAP